MKNLKLWEDRWLPWGGHNENKRQIRALAFLSSKGHGLATIQQKFTEQSFYSYDLLFVRGTNQNRKWVQFFWYLGYYQEKRNVPSWKCCQAECTPGCKKNKTYDKTGGGTSMRSTLALGFEGTQWDPEDKREFGEEPTGRPLVGPHPMLWWAGETGEQRRSQARSWAREGPKGETRMERQPGTSEELRMWKGWHRGRKAKVSSKWGLSSTHMAVQWVFFECLLPARCSHPRGSTTG